MAKILIAEDERDIRDLVAFTLRFAGYEVFSAANGEEAVALAPQVNPDLILMDVRMPLQMFVYPVDPNAAVPAEFTKYSQAPAQPATLAPDVIAKNRDTWIEAWTNVVMK